MFIQLFLFVSFLPLAHSQSIYEVKTKNGKIAQIQVSYGLLEPVKESNILKRKQLSKDDTYVEGVGGTFQIIPTIKIPFGKKFGIHWEVLNGDSSDSIPMRFEYIHSENKQVFPFEFPVKAGYGEFFVNQEEKDEPGKKTISMFQGDKLITSKTFDVYK
jgi:hypothetical protein